MNNEEKLKKVMKSIFNEEITKDFSKYTNEKWDSFLHLDLIVKLEDEFNITLTPEEMGKMDSFEEILGVINEKLL